MDVFRADSATGLGWVAPIYGRVMPGDHAARDGGPDSAVLGRHRHRRGPPDRGPVVTSLLDVLSGDAGSSACAVLTRRTRHLEVTVLRASRESRHRDGGDRAARQRGTHDRRGRCPRAHLRNRTAGTRVPRRCDGIPIRWGRPVTIASPSPVVDLDVRLEEGRAPVIATTSPLTILDLAGPSVQTPRRARATRRTTRVAAVRMSCVESPASPTR